jgi:hypothetical protein
MQEGGGILLLTTGLMEMQWRAADIAVGDRGAFRTEDAHAGLLVLVRIQQARQQPAMAFQVYRGRETRPDHPSRTVSKNGLAPDYRA